MKKITYIFLTLSLALAMAFASPMQILAAGTGNTVLTMSGKENTETKEIEIEVTVEENTGVCGMLLTLAYDTSVFTLTGLEYGPALSSLSPIHTNTETPEGYGVYPFKITYLGEKNDTSTGKMMILRFRVNDDAPDGSYTITLQYGRDKDVTYLKDNEILTKNLLIDGARITLSGSYVTDIETVPDTSGQRESEASREPYLVISMCALVLASGCSVIIPIITGRNKTKKWKKI